jgi:hypothetical protein
MVEPIGIGLVAGGVILLFAGAALSIYGVGLMGIVLGGGGGFLVAPEIGSALGLEGIAATAAAVAIGSLIGVAITYVLLSMAIAAMGFVVGIYVGVVGVNPILGDGSLMVTIGVALGTGVAAAFLGMLLTRTTMILITSFLGAALASRSITIDDFNEAANNFDFDPLVFEVQEPIFLGLLALGILSQFGLFKLGYVTKIVGLLPGATILTDNDDS